MDSITVKDLMVPLEGYTTIAKNASLGEAIAVLRDSRWQTIKETPGRPRDRAVLVLNDEGKVVGKLSLFEMLKGLEPRYEKVKGIRATARASSRIGTASHAIDHMIEEYSLWQKPLKNLVEKAANVKVKHLMRDLTKADCIEEKESLNKAIHQIIVGHHQSLIVTRNGEITGILRLSDVVVEVGRMIAKAQREAETAA